MQSNDITKQLERIADSDDFASDSSTLTDRWSSEDVSIDIVETILRFMEQHPEVDYGMPGALVHFVEEFFGRGYEERLVKSIERRPTNHTVWMLNRLINGTDEPDQKQRLVEILKQAIHHPDADAELRERIEHFGDLLNQEK